MRLNKNASKISLGAKIKTPNRHKNTMDNDQRQLQLDDNYN